MGQRSQIYIRYNGDLKVANYYQWCYGERLVSRARSIIEKSIDKYIEYEFYDGKMKRYCDVNFDMRDIVISRDIFNWYKEALEINKDTSSSLLFEEDNNDGKLFIDITQKCGKNPKIKYCFVDNYPSDRPLDAEAYMNWNMRYNYRIKHWEKYLVCGKEAKKDIVRYTRNNIKYIRENATLMTYEELQDFINAEYDENGKQIKPF